MKRPSNPKTYNAAHKRVRRERGSASQFVCVNCGRDAEEWAYKNGGPNELVNEVGYRFSPDPSDYEPMCRSCHARRDKRYSITHCPKGHPYSGDNLVIEGDGRARRCRICLSARWRRGYLKRRALRNAS